MGGACLGADSLLAKNIDWETIDRADLSKGIGLFSKKQIRLLDEIADTIIPTTDTPGAKAAKVGAFIAVMVSDCYEPDDQKLFLDGLVQLETDCKAKTGMSFQRCPAGQRHDFLVALDREQKEQKAGPQAGDPPHYFRRIKELTLLGYFTSEIGCTQALRMVEIPGRYDACIPYTKGDRAWGGY